MSHYLTFAPDALVCDMGAELAADGGRSPSGVWGVLVETPNGGFYEAPEGLGPLTIVEERDMILTLEAEDARRVRFDTLRRAWVDPAP